MKIIIAHKYYYQKAGAERYVFDSAKLLREQGHEVIPFAMHHPQNEQTPWSAYFVSHIDFARPSFLQKLRIPFRMIYSLEAKKKFRALVKKAQPDIVHIHNIYHQISPSILDVCREYKIPAVQTIHDYKMICPNYMLFSRGAVDQGCRGGKYIHDVWNASVKHSYMKSALAALEMYLHHSFLKIYEKNIQKFLMPSHVALEKFAEFGVPWERMMHLPYPIDVYKEQQDSSLTARNDIQNLENDKGNLAILSEHDKEKRILAFGRVSEEKGFDVLIRAMKDIDAHLDIIGEGPLRNKLETLVYSEGLSEKITVHGFQSREYISTYMDRASCVIVPSLWYEVLPYAILESYARGIPVIASNIGGMKELGEFINPGYLFTSGDSADCARVIGQALSHPDELATYGEKAREVVRKICDPEAHTQKLLGIYADVLNGPVPLDTL